MRLKSLLLPLRTFTPADLEKLAYVEEPKMSPPASEHIKLPAVISRLVVLPEAVTCANVGVVPPVSSATSQVVLEALYLIILPSPRLVVASTLLRSFKATVVR